MAQRVASELGHLTDAVATTSQRRRYGEQPSERVAVLRRRICEYLSLRRPDLDLLASDLKAARPAEEEWLQDYMRQARAERRTPSPERLEREPGPSRLMEFPAEHRVSASLHFSLISRAADDHPFCSGLCGRSAQPAAAGSKPLPSSAAALLQAANRNRRRRQ